MTIDPHLLQIWSQHRIYKLNYGYYTYTNYSFVKHKMPFQNTGLGLGCFMHGKAFLHNLVHSQKVI